MNVCPSSGNGSNCVPAQQAVSAANKMKVQSDCAGLVINSKRICVKHSAPPETTRRSLIAIWLFAHRIQNPSSRVRRAEVSS
jgi:hypothetical protein